MARNIRIDRSEAEFLTDLLLSSDNPMAKEIGDEIRDVFGMVSEEKEKQLTNEQITRGILVFMKCKSETPTKVRLPVKYNEGV